MLGLLKTEIFSTYNPQDYAQAKPALAQAGIRFYVRTVSNQFNQRNGSFGLNMDYVLQYRILVRNKDVDAAVHALHQGNRW